ncbi:retrovirus-related pol polyprotein from transposon TNT 1-94 [Tanacetum coccineum]
MPKSPPKLVDEPSDEGVLVEGPAYNEEEANLQRALELSLKDQGEQTQGPARLVVIREPNSRRIQPLPDVQGKGKEKVVDEQAARDLLTLQTPKKKSLANQFIFQRRTSMPIEASGHAESPSLDAELALTDSETESDNEVPKINSGDQDEGQAGLNPGDAAESQPQSSHVVPAGPNLEHMDLEATGASTQQKPEQMDKDSSGTLSSLQNLEKDLSFTDQFFVEKPQEEEPRKNRFLKVKNINVIALGMYKVHINPNQTRTPLLPQDIRKTNKRVSFFTGVIPTTSVSRPQLKSNQLDDRVLSNNSQGKKQDVEDHRRNFKFSKNKTSVTACNDSLNAKTSNVNFVCVTCGKCVLNDNHDLCVLHYINGVSSRTRQPIAVPISTREPKHNVNQSVATSSKKTIATDSTVKKSRHITRKLYEQVSKTCSWWYPKYTPPGYNWKPKSQIGNVNPNISMPLGNASRTANILEHKTPRCSTVSNTPLSSNSFAALRCSENYSMELLAVVSKSTHQTPTQVPTVIAPENIIQAETNTENAQFDDDEFINIFSTPVQEQGETSSRHDDNVPNSILSISKKTNHPSGTKRLDKISSISEQVIGNVLSIN